MKVSRRGALVGGLTVIAIAPFVSGFATGELPGFDGGRTLLAVGFYVLIAVTALRPIRVGRDVALDPSVVVVVGGVLLMPPAVVAVVAGLGRLTGSLARGERGWQPLRAFA